MSKELILSEAELLENEMLTNAIAYAVEMHKGGLRKGTNIPYIVHPLEVMHILYEMGADKKLMAAGVLHDTVEDTEATLDEIKELFGEEVADLVASHTEKDKSLPWRERKEIALAHLAKASEREQMLVLADKISNIEAMARDYEKIGDKLWERFNQGKEQQEWYYGEAMEALSALENNRELMNFYHRFRSSFDYIFNSLCSATYFYRQLEGLLNVSKADSALLNLKCLAEHGHIGAMIALAEAYQGTPAVKEDLAESFAWWEKAAKTGHPVAQYNFGKCFEKGKGVEVDCKQAFDWYLKAAEQGNVEAMNDIGICFAEGIVVDKDEEEAFRWFKRASVNESYAGALYNLASCYETGFGTEVNLAEAERLEKLADKLLAEGDNQDWCTVGETEDLEENYN